MLNFATMQFREKATANIIARRCVDTWTGKIDALLRHKQREYVLILISP